MTTESYVKIETCTDNRSRICYPMISNNNPEDNSLCCCMFTVENSECNEFIMLLNVKSFRYNYQNAICFLFVIQILKPDNNKKIVISLINIIWNFCISTVTGHLLGVAVIYVGGRHS